MLEVSAVENLQPWVYTLGTLTLLCVLMLGVWAVMRMSRIELRNGFGWVMLFLSVVFGACTGLVQYQHGVNATKNVIAKDSASGKLLSTDSARITAWFSREYDGKVYSWSAQDNQMKVLYKGEELECAVVTGGYSQGAVEASAVCNGKPLARSRGVSSPSASASVPVKSSAKATTRGSR